MRDLEKTNELASDDVAERRTPAALGYRMPAEWERHAGTWLSWPHNLETWPPDKLDIVERVLVKAVHALRTGEAIHVNVLDAAHEAHVRAAIGRRTAAHPVHFHHIPTNDAWCRDHGATFVMREQANHPLAAIDWTYNAWGEKYPPYDRDAAVARQMADTLGVPCFPSELVLEGGAIEGNGAGLLLTTASCVLNRNRNPDWTRAAVEHELCAMLGVQRIIWLEGELAGDDTDGHVDNLARFVRADTVVVATEGNPADANYATLRANLARLRGLMAGEGMPLRIVPLPMPEPVRVEGARLPASYANFYIGNQVVLVPQYDDPYDDTAMAILQELFPDRRTMGLTATSVLWGLGAFHCLTQPIPAV